VGCASGSCSRWLIHRRVCITRWPALSWRIMASFHVVPFTFGVRPNLSLNADVPHAGCARQRAAG